MSMQSSTSIKRAGGTLESKLDVLRQKPGLPMTGFFILQMILGFEWFWSGLAKMKMPGGFPAALPGELTDMLQSSPAWYGKFLSSVAIPHAAVFGYVIEISEFLIGIAFLFGPLLWFFAWERLPRSLKIALFSLTAVGAIGGFFMAVNFHIASGDPNPWILPTTGLEESVDIDSMVAAMQLVIATVHILLLTYIGKKKAE